MGSRINGRPQPPRAADAAQFRNFDIVILPALSGSFAPAERPGGYLGAWCASQAGIVSDDRKWYEIEVGRPRTSCPNPGVPLNFVRLALTAPFLLTKTIWPSYIAHLANDWSLFAFMLLPRLARYRGDHMSATGTSSRNR